MDWNPRANAIFLRLLEAESSVERQVLLETICGGDDSLRDQAKALWRAHEQASRFLEEPAGAPAGSWPATGAKEGAGVLCAPATLTRSWQALSEVAGANLGPYKLLQQIGEGGMGTVWMAEQQEPVK